MLIQCTQCQTVYNFDDSALQDSSIDVRCARCQSIFTVDAASAVGEDACRLDESELQGMSFRSNMAEEVETPTEEQPQTVAEQPLFEPEPEQTFAEVTSSTTHLDLHPIEEEAPEETPEEEFAFTPMDETLEFEDSSQQPAHDDAPEVDFSFAPLDVEPATVDIPQEETDFSFDDSQPNLTEQNTEAFSVDAAGSAENPETVEAPLEEAAAPQWDGGPDEFSFEDSGEDFSFEDEDSWSTKPKEHDSEEPSAQGAAAESPDFIFEPLTGASKEKPLQQATQDHEDDEIRPPQEAAAPQAPHQPAAPAKRGSSRAPKQGGPSKFLLFILLLLLIAAGAYGYFYATFGTTDVRVMIREVQQLIQPTAPQQPQGFLTITKSESYYIDNSEAGSLFVIEGTIRNDFKQPRAELSVTVTLYKDKGKAFTKKTVYCGNQVSRSDLETKPYQVLSETMSNPFGTALSNVGVAPGASIPFIVIFNDLSDDLSEFSIEPATSKAASN